MSIANHVMHSTAYNDSQETTMGANRKSGGQQKGAQNHGEGQHGDKTRKHIANAWNHPGVNASAAGANVSAGGVENERGPQGRTEATEAHAPPSGSHLFSGRSQHDEADLNSEKTRQVRDAERHGHIGDDEWSRRSAQASAKRKS